MYVAKNSAASSSANLPHLACVKSALRLFMLHKQLTRKTSASCLLEQDVQPSQEKVQIYETLARFCP